MGDMADDLFDMELEYAIMENLNKQWKFKNKIWTSRDGREIPVGELGTNHINNIINMIQEKRSFHDKAWIKILQAELESRN